MNTADENAIKWAIEKYWRLRSDKSIAVGLGVKETEVATMRQTMGLERGTETLKDFARRYLMELSEEEKTEFMTRLSPDLVWKMAEGNPHTTEDVSVHGGIINLHVVTYGNTDTLQLQPEAVPTGILDKPRTV